MPVAVEDVLFKCSSTCSSSALQVLFKTQAHVYKHPRVLNHRTWYGSSVSLTGTTLLTSHSASGAYSGVAAISRSAAATESSSSEPVAWLCESAVWVHGR